MQNLPIHIHNMERRTEIMSIHRSGKHALLLVLLIVALSSAYGETILADSTSRSAVAAAISSANTGDTVVVPAGTSTWTSQIQFNKEIYLIGAGIDETVIIYDGTSTSTPSDYVFLISADQDNPIRISGFTFDGNNEMAGISISGVAGKCTKLRIDNNKFTKCTSRAISVREYVYGVIDHNEFYSNATTDIVFYGDSDEAYTRPVELGTANALYIEDNLFVYETSPLNPGAAHAVASNDGSRYVFRYNTIESYVTGAPGSPVDVHGLCSGGNRGSFSYEIYGNTINSNSSGGFYRGMFIRGGTGVIFDNVMTGIIQHPIHLSNYRSWASFCSFGGGACTEYPCKDQIYGLYIWNNTHNGSLVTAGIHDEGLVSEHVQEGRDYFHMEKPGYTPYIYPHPLTAIETLSPKKIRLK